MANDDQRSEPERMSIEYEVPTSRHPYRHQRRRFALVRSWVYAFVFTGLTASFVAVAIGVAAQRGLSWGLLIGMGLACFPLGSLAYQSFRSIAMISDGRSNTPFN
jgi:hypothetical protein